jgi:multisubunit Na+/H+ antiporter MnhB subunit
MAMSEFFGDWQATLTRRDVAIESMALMALGIIALWLSLDILPVDRRWRIWIERVYLVCGLVMYAVTVITAVMAWI